MWRAPILVACGVFFFSALAAADARGSRSCHKWAEERMLAEGSKEMNKVPVLISKSWFLGYLSGRQAKARQDILGIIDNESIYLWLDKYCREHPQEDLASAGLALEQDLTSDKGAATGR